MSKQREEYKQLEEKVQSLENELKRAVADYHNLEKRVAEGRSELTSWGTNELVKKLLPVLDHLEKALDGVNGSDENAGQNGWVKGVELAVKEFKNVLQSEGLEEIVVEGNFNPALQEAVDTKEPSSAEASEGKGENGILEIVQKGYTMNGKILRPARVVVGKKNVIASEAKQSGLEEEEIATSPSAPRNDEAEEESK
ncbi:MAG: nucleotide exchange factor GrpE [Candidatus Daviesbacteria bacterium]|nr:nucleotide exchange factor GrpE [Candidatus Daviesbacteria bacterium]